MKIVNKLSRDIFVEYHFDLSPFYERRSNLKLLFSSHAGMHSLAPFSFIGCHEWDDFILQLHLVPFLF